MGWLYLSPTCPCLSPCNQKKIPVSIWIRQVVHSLPDIFISSSTRCCMPWCISEVPLFTFCFLPPRNDCRCLFLFQPNPSGLLLCPSSALCLVFIAALHAPLGSSPAWQQHVRASGEGLAGRERNPTGVHALINSERRSPHLKEVNHLLAAVFIFSQARRSQIELWKRSTPQKNSLGTFLSLLRQGSSSCSKLVLLFRSSKRRTSAWCYLSSTWSVREDRSRVLLLVPVTAEGTACFHTGGSTSYPDQSETTARLWISNSMSPSGQS